MPYFIKSGSCQKQYGWLMHSVKHKKSTEFVFIPSFEKPQEMTDKGISYVASGYWNVL